MKDAMRNDEHGVALQQDIVRKTKPRPIRHCSICNNRIWFDPVRILEPEGVPEPRLSWVLCKECHGELLDEVRRSPVRSPLRLRIAVGIVAAERWPHAYPTHVQQFSSDRRMIIFMAISFIVAMVLHLGLIVMVAGFH